MKQAQISLYSIPTWVDLTGVPEDGLTSLNVLSNKVLFKGNYYTIWDDGENNTIYFHYSDIVDGKIKNCFIDITLID